ncbi:cyclophilin-like fold protein [Acetobacter senegalensis]|uniref:cyclophilin-like fold protein n=2 Tax=Acetobacteraceae TaxID=433 RepID=UPI00265575C8|nr:cyclophilin-like fold protein [Acetobacter senegalensis]MDN7356232.1 cyclophilin-like fold protein [Acetobacter senegalensis]
MSDSQQQDHGVFFSTKLGESVYCVSRSECVTHVTVFAKVSSPDGRKVNMKIRLTLGEQVIFASLEDTPSGRDFLSLLPMTLMLEDYNATEKICDLPRHLSSDKAPKGYAPSAGDITYYAPWGNIAIFYRNFEYSSGLIKLGQIEDNLEGLALTGRIKMQVEAL